MINSWKKIEKVSLRQESKLEQLQNSEYEYRSIVTGTSKVERTTHQRIGNGMVIEIIENSSRNIHPFFIHW